MGDFNFQLNTPFSNWGTGYKKPDFFGDRFKLSTLYLPNQLGWTAQAANGQTANYGTCFPGGVPGVTDSFSDAAAAVARSEPSAAKGDSLAKLFASVFDDKIWDTLYGLLRGAGPNLWPDVPGPKKNVVTGDKVPAGKLAPNGTFVPSGPDDQVAGVGIPLPAISLGKRFLYASNPDVHLYIYMDKDAVPQKSNYLLSGGGVGLEGKTSGGTQFKFRVGVGRDAAGGGAGFFTIQIGPDYVQMPQQ